MINSAFLRSSSLFNAASVSVIQEIADQGKLLYFKKGTVIFNSEASSVSFFLIKNGWVKLACDTADGTENIIDVLTAQDYFGEHELVGVDYGSFHAQAVSDVEIISVPIVLLQALLRRDSFLSYSFLHATLNKERLLKRHVEHLSKQTTTQRMGCFLLRLCSANDTHNIRIKLPYDKALLASRLGMRPETFSRVLGRLCEDCHVDVEQDVIVMKDLETLVQNVCGSCSQTYPCQNLSKN